MERKSIALILLVAALLLAAPTAHAQEPITLASLTVRIWPEFDQPSALVFFIGQVAGGTPLPAELRFSLPTGATVHAVAFIDESGGGLLSAQYRQEGSEIVVTSPNGSFWVEFYDAALQVEGQQRTYALAWTAPYAIATLTYEVQSPYGAQGLAVEPAGGALSTDDFGLPLYTIARNGIAAGETLELRMTYSKADNRLTADQLSPAAGESIPQATTGTAVADARAGVSPLAVALLAAGGLLILGGAGYWFFQTVRPFSRRTAPTPQAKGGGGFCPQCGRPAQAGDRFCRHCGARLRGT